MSDDKVKVYDIANLSTNHKQEEPETPIKEVVVSIPTPADNQPQKEETTLTDIQPVTREIPVQPIQKTLTREEIMNKTRQKQQPGMVKKSSTPNIISPQEMTSIIGVKEDEKMKPPTESVIQKALRDFDDVLNKKREEANRTLEILREKSDRNRMLIANGIEEEPVEEEMYMNYLGKLKEEAENDKEKDFDAMLEDEMREAEENAKVYNNQQEQRVVIGSTNDVFMKTDVGITDSVQLTPTYEASETLVENIGVEATVSDDTNETWNTLEVKEESEIKEILPEIKDEPKEEIKTHTPEKEYDAHKAKDIQKAMFSNSTKIINTPEINKVNVPVDGEKLASDMSIIGLDDSDFADITGKVEEVQEEETGALPESVRLDEFRSEILNKIVNVAKNINISTFKVSKKVASVSKVLANIDSTSTTNPTDSVAKFALFNAGRPYTCSSLSGPEIVTMFSEDSDSAMATNAQLQILYNHDTNPYKPNSLKAWCKSIPFYDLNNIFMAQYMATFKRANYLPRTCSSTSCQHLFLENIPDIFKNMIKFTSKEHEEKFNKIMETELILENSLDYEVVIIPVTENIAIGFKLPSIYNYLMELRAIPKDFLDKYSSVITTIMFIDSLYEIDYINGELNKIPYKEYKDSIVKNFKSKMVTYANILNKIESVQYTTITAYMNKFIYQKEITYFVPESTCVKCNSIIEEQETDPKTLLFTQPRLVNIATISIE